MQIKSSTWNRSRYTNDWKLDLTVWTAV